MHLLDLGCPKQDWLLSAALCCREPKCRHTMSHHIKSPVCRNRLVNSCRNQSTNLGLGRTRWHISLGNCDTQILLRPPCLQPRSRAVSRHVWLPMAQVRLGHARRALSHKTRDFVPPPQYVKIKQLYRDSARQINRDLEAVVSDILRVLGSSVTFTETAISKFVLPILVGQWFYFNGEHSSSILV